MDLERKCKIFYLCKAIECVFCRKEKQNCRLTFFQLFLTLVFPLAMFTRTLCVCVCATHIYIRLKIILLKCNL